MVTIKYANQKNEELARQILETFPGSAPASSLQKVDQKEMSRLEKTDQGQDIYDLIVHLFITKAISFSLTEFFNLLKWLLNNRRKGTVQVRVNEDKYIQNLDLENMTLKDIQKLEYQLEEQKKKLIKS
ncbi:hypothetical protein HB364_29575 [Pseudoflavitalea sp. X16]|uniref:hypothetical protein n=1 Tax=Paraflavitalea devenefica TaxID=2716334 RepID=UPI001423F71A|nr:hypothetical protein [Paraflavitalea devenefica]NII29266.1 hypothetical protein [Paraflavitalea devenefica]